MFDSQERKLLLINVILTIVLVLMGVYYVVQVKSPVQVSLGGTDDIYKPLMDKLSKHSELADYSTANPVIAKITQADLTFASQNNLSFFNNAKAGDYLLNYVGMQLIYDFKQDKIVNVLEQPKAPTDLLPKLFAHKEVADHNTQVPQATKLDDNILNAARANNQDFFARARSGDYFLEWSDLIVLYDYNNDVIVNLQKRFQLPTDFVTKLLAHTELASHSNENPTITLLDQAAIDQGKTANAEFFASAKSGQYLLQWTDLFIVFDYETDKIVSMFQPERAPDDFLPKLTAHSEMAGYVSQVPRISRISASVLPQLKEQFANIYANAKADDYVVRYNDRLVIYDYAADKIVDMFSLEPGATQ